MDLSYYDIATRFSSIHIITQYFHANARDIWGGNKMVNNTFSQVEKEKSMSVGVVKL